MKTTNLSTHIMTEYMRNFVNKSIKSGRCSALNQYYKSSLSDEIFNIISQETDIKGNKFEKLDTYFERTNKHRKTIENEYDSRFIYYRDNDEEERTKHINRELNKLPIHKKLPKLDIHNDVLMDYDGNSLYPSAMWDENSVYPKMESGFAFAPHMNDV